MRCGVYAGSFDPPNLGHLDIIRRAFSIVDRLVVAIGVNPLKQSFFSIEERVSVLEYELNAMGLDEKQYKVIAFEGLLIETMVEYEATLIIKGLRSALDYDYEAPMALMNRAMAENVETVFLTASADMGFISSTQLRQIAKMGKDIRLFAPNSVIDVIQKKHL